MDRQARERHSSKYPSIRGALLLAVCTAILPPSAIIVFSGIEHGRYLADHVHSQVERQALAFAAIQTRITASTRQLLQTLSALPAFKADDRPLMTEILKSVHQNNPEYINLAAVDARGIVTASSLLPPGTDLSFRPHVRRVLSERRFVAGDYFLNRVDSAPSFAFMTPIFNDAGELSGGISATLVLTSFDHLFDHLKLPEDSFLGLVDSKGTRLYFYPPRPTNLLGQPIKQSVWEKLRFGDESQTFVDSGSDGLKRLYGFRSLSLEAGGDPYIYVVYAVPSAALLAESWEALVRNILLMLAATILSLIFAAFLAQKLFGARFALIMAATTRLREGDLGARANLGNDSSDLGQIGVALDSMAESLELRDAEKEEVARSLAASLTQKNILLKEIHHRVKNNLQMVLSLVRLQEDVPCDIVEFRKNIESRISAMAVAHEMLYEAGDVGVVDLGAYTERLIELIASTWKVSVELSVQYDRIRCNLDTAIPFGLVLHELTINAFKHAFKVTGSGRFSVSVRNSAGEIVLEVADDGPGLPVDFSIVASPGLGLRLALALSLQLAGTFSWSTGCGQRFSLRFPSDGRLA